jgi:hypothetical protein
MFNVDLNESWSNKPMCVLKRKLVNTVLQKVDGCTFEDCTETVNCQLYSTLDGRLAKKTFTSAFIFAFIFIFILIFILSN